LYIVFSRSKDEEIKDIAKWDLSRKRTCVKACDMLKIYIAC